MTTTSTIQATKIDKAAETTATGIRYVKLVLILRVTWFIFVNEKGTAGMK